MAYAAAATVGMATASEEMAEREQQRPQFALDHNKQEFGHSFKMRNSKLSMYVYTKANSTEVSN